MTAIWREALSQRDREGGFSLVELIVAMVVIAIVLMLLIGVQISAISTVTEARKLQQATALANEALEQMRAMPWQVLSKGMASNFMTASGGDDLVTGEYLQVDGAPIRLLIAPASNDQDWLTGPERLPLFNYQGSHIQYREDPSLTGVVFTIKAYVTEGIESSSSGTLGIAVVVEWPGAGGEVGRTLVRSTVHQSGCGDTATQPFLASCQDNYEANAGTGEIVITTWAPSSVDTDPIGTLYPLTHPEVHSVYRTTVSTAGVASAIESQQVTTSRATVQFGGHQTDDNDPATDYLAKRGYTSHEIRATNDPVNPGALPTDDTMNPLQGASAESETTISYPSGFAGRPSFRIRSDYARAGSGRVDMAGGCETGIGTIEPNQPCGVAKLDHEGVANLGSGYTVMNYAGEIIRLARPMTEQANGNSVEHAWTARFVTEAGDATLGCETLVGSGCVAAGAQRTISDVRIANIREDQPWDDSAAPQGLVIVQGRPGYCATYSDSVRVQRGPGQVAGATDLERCGVVRYWTATGYADFVLDWDSIATLTTPVVSYTSGIYTITAESQVSVVPGYEAFEGSPDCAATSCSVTASPGSIIIATDYVLSWDSTTHGVRTVVEITPPTARASFTAGIGD